MAEDDIAEILKSIDKNIKKLGQSTTKKDTTMISIVGIFNEQGIFEQELERPFITSSNSKYFVYLKRFQTINSIKNIKAGINDKFRYTPPGGTLQTITLPEGLYDVECFSNIIKTLISSTDVEFRLDESTGKTKHVLLNGYTVTFSLTDTFAPHLGYGNQTISEIGLAPNTVDLMSEKSIFIGLSIISGSGAYFRGKPSNIIHSFSPNYKYGDLILETISFKIPFLLSHNNFQKIYVDCFDQDKNPIDFGGENFVLDIVIQES